MTTDTADTVIRRANAYYFQGRCDDAIGLLADFMARTPHREGVAVRAAELLIDSERYAQALEFLGSVDAWEAHHRTAFLTGLCKLSLGDFKAAESIADRIIEQKGEDASALVLKARMAASWQNSALVEQLLTRALESDPSSGIAWHDYAALRRQQGDLQACFLFSQRAFRCAPESREIACAFHEISLTVQKLPEAEAAFREALCARRMDRRLRYFLIDLLLRGDRFAEAMGEVEAAIVDFGVDPGILGAALKIRKYLGPMSLPQLSKPGGSVSLCTIVKNEEYHLARCLASAKPFVDEIIVVDTGSTDATQDIANAFGATVFEFEWVDDFSKARNFALSKASGDWILVLDADEALSSADCGEFRRMLETSSRRLAAFSMQTRNYSNMANTLGFRPNRGEYPEEKGMGWYPSDKVRLFPNDARIRFDYPVHELVEPSLRDLKMPIRKCPIAVHHYGVLNDIHAREKTSNYRKLGKKKVKNFKNSASLKEAAIQSSRVGKHAESLGLWRRFLKRHPRSAEAYLNIGAVCSIMGRHAEAAENSQKALKLDPKLKEARFNLALALLMQGKAENAQTLLKPLLQEHPDDPAVQFLLCVAYACRSDRMGAEELFRKLRAISIGEYIGESFLNIGKRFLEFSRRDYAICVLKAALEFGCSNPEIRTLLENRCVAA